jgi:tRNA uridine 5-carboxymethylaminomethyl modification enzyme
MQKFDVIVVGGGHAGIEAAHAAAKLGSHTALITLDPEKIGLMPCNPSIGGVGKGHIVHEIAALGGVMPHLCTQTYLQARMLNTSKGAAVQGLRLQIDKQAYNKASKSFLEELPNLKIIKEMVDEVLLDNDNAVYGIRTNTGAKFFASSVVLTSGTFLNGVIHVGSQSHSAGRQGEGAVTALSGFLRRAGLQMDRLKTGTPPRLLKSSIDFSKITYQEPDTLSYLFEFYPIDVVHTQACYITHTNEETHAIIKRNVKKSAMYSGKIKGKGPRYCPSIEDKVIRFPEKTSHTVFVEPEGAHSDEVYPSGLSTSLPLAIQEQYIQSIRGFETAVITKPGYAVEYDFVFPHQLNHTLELKTIPGLFLAGQLNGTTGYEEAAGQGIVAGINAHLLSAGKEPFILERTESYIGVMIDDLVTMSVDEPYRMFTSRAEHRLLLRQDNAFVRLADKAYVLGMIDKEIYRDIVHEKETIKTVLHDLNVHYTSSQLINDAQKDALRHPLYSTLSVRAQHTVKAEVLYSPYLKREMQEIKRYNQYKNLKIPESYNYTAVAGLSKELTEKLITYKPQTIAQASRIPGMTPAALTLLIVTVRKVLNSTPEDRAQSELLSHP